MVIVKLSSLIEISAIQQETEVVFPLSFSIALRLQLPMKSKFMP